MNLVHSCMILKRPFALRCGSSKRVTILEQQKVPSTTPRESLSPHPPAIPCRSRSPQPPTAPRKSLSPRIRATPPPVVGCSITRWPVTRTDTVQSPPLPTLPGSPPRILPSPPRRCTNPQCNSCSLSPLSNVSGSESSPK